MKKILVTISAICAVLFIASCNSDKFTIKAKIAHLADQKVILNRPGMYGLEPVDTVESVDGEFIFTGKLDRNDYRIITFEDASGEIDLYIDNSDIKVTGDYVHLDSVEVKGSPAMDYYEEFAEVQREHNSYVKGKVEELQQAQIDGDTAKVDAIYAEYLEKQKEFVRDNFELAKKRPADMISIFAVMNSMAFSTPDELKEFYDAVPKDVKEDPRVGETIAQMERVVKLSKGNPFPEFTLYSYDGKDTVTQKSFEGKASLVYVTTPDVKEDDIIYPQLHKASQKGISVYIVMMLSSEEHYFLYEDYVKDLGLDKLNVLTGSEDFVETTYAVSPRVLAVDSKSNYLGTAIETDDIKDMIDNILK